jgi:hypothetical protein
MGTIKKRELLEVRDESKTFSNPAPKAPPKEAFIPDFDEDEVPDLE